MPPYATTAQLRRALGGPSTSEVADEDLYAALEAASAEVDRIAGRTFAAPSSGARYFTARYGNDLIEIDDLLSVTSIKTDTDGDRTYATTWATADYDLEPVNAAAKGLPYTHIRRRRGGEQHFERDQRQGIEVTGSWGYSAAVPAVVVSATLAMAASVVQQQGGQDEKSVRVGDIAIEYRDRGVSTGEAPAMRYRAMLGPVLRRRVFS